MAKAIAGLKAIQDSIPSGNSDTRQIAADRRANERIKPKMNDAEFALFCNELREAIGGLDEASKISCRVAHALVTKGLCEDNVPTHQRDMLEKAIGEACASVWGDVYPGGCGVEDLSGTKLVAKVKREKLPESALPSKRKVVSIKIRTGRGLDVCKVRMLTQGTLELSRCNGEETAIVTYMTMQNGCTDLPVIFQSVDSKSRAHTYWFNKNLASLKGEATLSLGDPRRIYVGGEERDLTLWYKTLTRIVRDWTDGGSVYEKSVKHIADVMLRLFNRQFDKTRKTSAVQPNIEWFTSAPKETILNLNMSMAMKDVGVIARHVVIDTIDNDGIWIIYKGDNYKKVDKGRIVMVHNDSEVRSTDGKLLGYTKEIPLGDERKYTHLLVTATKPKQTYEENVYVQEVEDTE